MINLKTLSTCNEHSPEMQLLLLSCIYELSGQQQRNLQALAFGIIDWDLFMKLVIRHRVYPVVYKNLVKIQNVNQDVLFQLEKRYRQNVKNSLKLTAELVRIMSNLEERGIRAISLKGPALGLSLYGEISSRVSRDLDILVDRVDVEKAEAMLLSQGYHINNPDIELTPKQKKTMYYRGHHFSYISDDNICIELHWQYYYESYHFQFQQVWENRSEIIVSGNSIHILNPEENFLYMVFHGSKHAWKRLKWLCDVCEAVKKNKLNWGHVISRSKELGITEHLGQELLLIRHFFELELPLQLTEVSFTKHSQNLAVMALQYIFHSDEQAGERGHPLYLLKKRYLLAWHIGYRRKVKFITVHFQPSINEFKSYQFDDKHYFMYYIIRPFLKTVSFIKHNYGM